MGTTDDAASATATIGDEECSATGIPSTPLAGLCEEAAAAVVVDTIVREVADVAVVELPAIAIWAEGATTDSQGEHKGQLTRIQCPSFIISLL